MRVLYHIPFPVVGGAETQIGYLLKELRGKISPLITYEYSEVESFVGMLGVPYERIFSPTTLVRKISAFHPDIIQFYHSHCMYAALKKLPYAPKVVEVVHNRLPFPGDCSSYPKDRTSICVGVSQDAANNFIQHATGVRTAVIPNGVDVGVFNPKLRANRERNSRRIGGFTGRLEEGDGKGIPALLRVAESCPDVDFELVGKDFGGYARSCSLPNVRFYPHRQDVSDFYRRWDFFISMSPAEGFGLSIAEAYHCGLPALVLDCGGVCDFLRDEIIIAHDEMAMINAIQGQMIRTGPRKADLSAKLMAERYLDLYKQLIFEQDPLVGETVHPNFHSKKTDAIVGVCPADWHGVKRSLMGYCDEVVTPQTAKAFFRRTVPRVVVFGCYTPQWEDVLLEAKRLGCKTVLTWHASYILNEFDHVNREWMWHALTAAKKKLFDYVATTHAGLANTWTRFGIGTDFLPNVIDRIPPLIERKRPGLHIGILGSGQPWKNLECQIIAASMVPRATVHVQGLKHSQSLDALGVRFNKVPFMPSDEEYFRFMGEMTVNMVVSLSETYSYFAAESMLVGTPIITTPITPVTQGDPALDDCITPHFEDPEEIARTIEKVLKNYERIRAAGRERMLELNELNKDIVKKVISSWV